MAKITLFGLLNSSYFYILTQKLSFIIRKIQSMSSNIFISTISRFKMNQTIAEIAQDCKKEINISIYKNMHIRVHEILQKYELLEKKFTRGHCNENAIEWKEEQKKILLCFLLAFCHLHFKKISEIVRFLNTKTNTEWMEISAAFHNKNILLIRYEAKSIQKNGERVHWNEKQQLLLLKYIKNGMIGKWAEISRQIFFESEGDYFKTPKQCRQHWFNHMNRSIVHGEWTIEEDLIILESVLDYGHKWARVVDLLDGKRTEHMIKNRFHSLLTFSTKIIENQTQRKNEVKIIKIMINQLTRKKLNLKKVHSSPPSQSQDSLIQDQKLKKNVQQVVDQSQWQNSRDVTFKGVNKIEGEMIIEKCFSMDKNSKNEPESIKQIISIAKQNKTIHQISQNPLQIYYNYNNAYYPGQVLTPVIFSPIFTDYQVFYHSI